MFLKRLLNVTAYQQAKSIFAAKGAIPYRRIITAGIAGSSIMAKYNVVFVLGGPGAGKGTQCQNIVEEFGYTHLSAGDLLRAERNNKESEYGALIDSYIKEGKIVPVKITCGLLERAMKETVAANSEKNNFLIDGFPRNQDNLEGWQQEMGSKTNLQFVLFFECDEKTCVERCLSRGQGRTDDNPDSLKKRFVTYYESTKPIIDYYEKSGSVRTIDAKRNVQEVFTDVKKTFSEIKS